MTQNDTAAHFLQTYAAGGEVPGGWLYGKALQQARLDFSPESVGRLDQMLAQLRERVRPTIETVDSLRGRNFLSLIVFYVIEIVRRRTGADLVWHDRESALHVLPSGSQLPESPVTRLLANAFEQGVLFMPLGWLGAQVLPGGHAMTAADYIASAVQQLERHGPAVWWEAMTAAGRMASWQMMWIFMRRPVAPTMLSQRRPETWEVIATSRAPDPGFGKSLEYAGRRLDENPEGARWQVLSHGGFVDGAQGRVEALIVVASAYGDRPLRVTLAFPYRPAVDGARFAILAPVLRDANVSSAQVGALQVALERGVRSVKWANGHSWDAWREDQAS